MITIPEYRLWLGIIASALFGGYVGYLTAVYIVPHIKGELRKIRKLQRRNHG